MAKQRRPKQQTKLKSVSRYLPDWDSEDAEIALRAAISMAEYLKAPVVILFDLSVRPQNEAPSRYLERVTPKLDCPR